MPLPWSGFIWSKGNLWTICAMSKAWKCKATTGRKFWKKKWSHIEKCGSTCFLSFLQRKLQLAPPSSAAPCDKVCSGKSGKRNCCHPAIPPWWAHPVPSLHALLARPHWVTKATFCGCHTAAQEHTSSLFTVSPGLTHEQRSVTTPLLPVLLPCSKIDQIKGHCKVSYCLAARSLGLFLLQLNKTFQLVLTASKRLRNIYSDIHREYFCDQDRIKHKPLLSLNSADEDPPYLSWG